MQITEVFAARAFEGGNPRARNLTASVLLVGEEGSPNNYMMALTTADEPHPTPRHKHNFEQVRFPFSGEFEYEPEKILGPGQLMYFPESVHYGPQLRRNCTMITTQFGSASGYGFLSEKQRRKAYDELKAKGTFEKGLYTYVDEQGRKHNRDTFEAVWEHLKGSKVVYPEPRYSDLVLMEPRNFGWAESKKDPGVAYKWLGRFTERDFRIGFAKVDSGATLTVASQGAPHLLFMMSGAVTHNGKDYDDRTAFAVHAADGAQTIKARKPSEFYYLKLHEF